MSTAQPPTPAQTTEALVDRVRAACAWVAERAEHVTVERGRVAAYARALPAPVEAPFADEVGGPPERRAAFVLCLDAVNFGSGWWPTIRKRPGCSGATTMATALTDHFRDRGGWSAAALAELTREEVAAVFGQDPGHELMGLYAAALRDLGARVQAEEDGRFLGVVERAGGSAAALAERLAGWSCFADASPYRGREIPLYKRAQIAAADLHRAGVAALGDLHRLTAFADNLVPHVLAVDGILTLDPALAARIARGELLEHDSPAEVELRACAIHAIELLAAASGRAPAALDELLWHRGRAPRYKSRPRPRSRTTAY